MTKTIDRNSQRYEQTSEKRRQAGLKGMQKRWGTKKEGEEICEKTDTFVTNVTKITDNDNDNDNDNENVNVNDNVNDKSAEADLRDNRKKINKKRYKRKDRLPPFLFLKKSLLRRCSSLRPLNRSRNTALSGS